LGAERLDHALSSQQAGAQLHRHILVVYHIHYGNILLHPRGLEFLVLSLRQEVVDGVLQFILIVTATRSDGLPGGISHNIIDRCSEGWPLVPVEDHGSGEDLLTTLNSTCPRHGILLILYLGVEVMPKCPSRARSLPVWIEASTKKDSLLSASLYSFSPSLLLKGEYSSSYSSSLSTSWSSCYYCSSVGAP
jgi:hypothetical protein